LCICENGTGTALGFVDLFDFEPSHKRVGVGIIIYNKQFQNKGIGSESLSLIEDYCFQILDLHQIYANVLEENQKSNHVFTKLGYQKVGVKKDWIRFNKEFKNEILYQKIRP
jgi:diamine N-acetyltransferase